MIAIIVACVLLAIIILAQNPKGGGLSGTFGGASSASFGIQRTNDFVGSEMCIRDSAWRCRSGAYFPKCGAYSEAFYGSGSYKCEASDYSAEQCSKDTSES